MKSMYSPGLKLEVRNIRAVGGGWLDKTKVGGQRARRVFGVDGLHGVAVTDRIIG